jgi:hypothetical protein
LLRLVRPLRKVLICVLPVVFALGAGSAVAGLQPDPPPKPPQPEAPAQPAPVQPAPAQRASVQPAQAPSDVAKTTSSNEKAAARLAANGRARAARLRAQRARAARAHARAQAQARARARATRLHARQATSAALVRRRDPPAAETLFEPKSRAASVMPLGPLLMGLALLLFSLAAVPACAVPWSRTVRTLETRREELAFLGIATFLATAALFLAG